MSADLAPYAVDPFGPSANPGAYVACHGSERARAALERSLDAGRVAALVGPPGHGKTLLLRLLGGREQQRARVAYVPFTKLETDEFCALVLDALGAPRADEPHSALLDLTRTLAARGGIVLLVDDAHGMSDDCADSLAKLHREAAGRLRIAMAAVEGPNATRVCRCFGDAIDVVPLAQPLSEPEARRYVETRLAYGGAQPELVAAFDDATIQRLHRISQGVPRRLNQAAEDIVRRASPTEIPRLRELAGLEEPSTTGPEPPAAGGEPVEAPTAERAPHLVVVPTPPPPREEEVAAPTPAAQGPPAVPFDRPPPPLPLPPPPPTAQGPPAPEPPRRERPTREPPQPPRPDPGLKDDRRGILLPDAFGQGPVEDRLADGRFVDPATGRPPVPQRDDAEPRRHVIPASLRNAAPESVDPERSRTDALRRKALAAPPPKRRRRGLPIRTLGLAGFLLGLILSLLFLRSTGPRVLPEPPAVDAAAPQPGREGDSAAAKTAPKVPARRAAERGAGAREAPRDELDAPQPPAATTTPVRVSINATPWAIIEVDGREIGETPLAAIPIDPGLHVFRARMANGTTRERVVDISSSNDTVVFQ